MANAFGMLVNAVNTATSPQARNAAAKALAGAIADAAGRGEDVRSLFEGALGGAAALTIGPAQLAVIGIVQRYLADVASGAVVPTPPSVAAILAQLAAVLGGIGNGMPALPGVPGVPGLPQWPGLPLQIPQIPGLDACKFIKCLASSMDCSGSPGGGLPGTDGKGDDPIGRLVGSGIEMLKRARDLAAETSRQSAALIGAYNRRSRWLRALRVGPAPVRRLNAV